MRPISTISHINNSFHLYCRNNKNAPIGIKNKPSELDKAANKVHKMAAIKYLFLDNKYVEIKPNPMTELC